MPAHPPPCRTKCASRRARLFQPRLTAFASAENRCDFRRCSMAVLHSWQLNRVQKFAFDQDHIGRIVQNNWTRFHAILTATHPAKTHFEFWTHDFFTASNYGKLLWKNVVGSFQKLAGLFRRAFQFNAQLVCRAWKVILAKQRGATTLVFGNILQVHYYQNRLPVRLNQSPRNIN